MASASSSSRMTSSSKSRAKQRDQQPKTQGGQDSSDALAALEAHFLATFGDQAAASTSKQNEQHGGSKKGNRKAKKTSAVQQAPLLGFPTNGNGTSTDGSEEEEEEEWSGLTSSDDDEDELQGIFTGESSSETSEDLSALRQRGSGSKAQQPPRRVPQTIVFDEGMSGRRGRDIDDGSVADAKKSWRDFMKSQTANTGPDSMTSASETLRLKVAERKQREAEARANRANGSDDEDDEDEAEQLTKDRQLSHLLNTTLFANGSNGSSSTSHGRKKSGEGDDAARPNLSSHATLARLLDLSSSSKARKGQTFGRGHGDKALRASQLSQMPNKMRQGIRSAAGHRAQLDVERKAELGLLGDAHSRKLMGRQEADATMTGKAKAKRDRQRGLGMGVGKFQGGVLKLSDKEVNSVLGKSDRDRGKRQGSGGSGRSGGAMLKKRKTG